MLKPDCARAVARPRLINFPVEMPMTMRKEASHSGIRITTRETATQADSRISSQALVAGEA